MLQNNILHVFILTCYLYSLSLSLWFVLLLGPLQRFIFTYCWFFLLNSFPSKLLLLCTLPAFLSFSSGKWWYVGYRGKNKPRYGRLLFYSHLLLSFIPLKEKQLRESAHTRETPSSLGFCLFCTLFSSHTELPSLCYSQHSHFNEEEANVSWNNFVVLYRVWVVVRANKWIL